MRTSLRAPAASSTQVCLRISAVRGGRRGIPASRDQKPRPIKEAAAPGFCLGFSRMTAPPRHSRRRGRKECQARFHVAKHPLLVVVGGDQRPAGGQFGAGSDTALGPPCMRAETVRTGRPEHPGRGGRGVLGYG